MARQHSPTPAANSNTGSQPMTREQLLEVHDQFITAWGQMASAWGVSRTMAEVFALLYISGQALNTDQVMERLRISRGNASMSLRSLVEWGIVSRVHRRGERKEFFQAEQDVWGLSRKVIRERLRREILPLLTTLYELRDQTETKAGHTARGAVRAARKQPDSASAASPPPPEPLSGPSSSRLEEVSTEELAEHNQRLDGLLELVQTIDKLGERFVGAEGKGLRLAASVLAKIV